MPTFFIACAGLGGLILVAQVLLGLFGFDHGVGDLEGDVAAGGSGIDAGLELLSVRAISAGIAFFGVGGWAAEAWGAPGPLAALVALVPGAAGMVATAWMTRQVRRLESDGSIVVERAVGTAGTVYLTVPPGESGAGRVQLALQGRTVELRAVTRERSPIPTGSQVVVVGVVDGDTVEVIPTSTMGELLDGHA
jgi:hypothetical protein